MNKIQLAIIVIWSAALFAQGRIIPRPVDDGTQHRVYLKSVNATVKLNQRVGNVKLEQEFYNESNRRLEGDYIFGLPGEAQIHDFHLYINGKKTQGELLDSKEAYQTYEDIVRRMRDPALLEFAGYGLFKARIFPIEPKRERKIELSYAQIASYDNDTYRFTLPIRQSGQGSIEKFHMTIELEGQSALGNIYSPSHDIDISRIDDRHAKISMEANQLEGDKDFVLYYSLANLDVNATLLTFRPRTDRDGYFILLATPKYEITEGTYIPRDIAFVVDVSGSMGGEKIEQARNALRYCINTLKPQDRFEIISFSSSIENFQDGLKNAGQDEIQNALYFIDNLSASGGTNIDAALNRALGLKETSDNHPTSIVFLTDGLPTEGEEDVNRILQNIKDAGKDFVRFFNFGVGYDVNTFLLDKLSQDHHGSANYVKPGENIEREVSTFFAKISSPVLTNPQIDFGQSGVYDAYPQQLPDIFQGQRITVLGRYRKPGDVLIKLSGKQGSRTHSFEYKVSFGGRETDNEFISKLWANRKVANLLSQIRFNGENPELVESVKSLGKEYGIVTPYTSYLVTEQEKELAAVQQGIENGDGGSGGLNLLSAQRARKSKAEMDEESVGSLVMYDALMAAPEAAASSYGKGAVMSSRAMKKISSADKEMNMILTITRVGDRTFNLKNGIWIESGLDENAKADRSIAFLDSDYFSLSKTRPELCRILALGEQVIFRWEGKIYKITN
jgi:Ca-activated chloride channel family protein